MRRDRYFALLLRLLPAEFRKRHGEELAAVVEQMRRELGPRPGTIRLARFYAALTWDVVRQARATRSGGASARGILRRHGSGREWGEKMALTSWWNDWRIAARALARRPGFTLAVALTLGLGIGATTTVWSVVDAVVLRPLPYEDPSTLVAAGALEPGAEWLDQEAGLQNLTPISFLNFVDLRERARGFEQLSAIIPFEESVPSADGGERETIEMAAVTPGVLEMLGASPAIGRSFTPDDYVASPEVVLLTHGVWQQRFAADPGVVGRTLDLEGIPPARIIGVLPEDFDAPEAFFASDAQPDLWIPYWEPESQSRREERLLLLLGRLRPGTTVQQTREEARRIAADLAEEYPAANQQDADALGIGVNGLHAQTVGVAGKGLGLFLAAAALLLLLAALNASTLLLTRALDRTQELSVRAALGAARQRVAHMLLTESAILAALGCGVGVALAYVGVTAFTRFAPSSMPRLEMVAVDARVLLAAAAISIVTGIGAGLLPVSRLTGRGPWERMQRGGRTSAPPSSRLSAALVTGQLALAVVLLFSAALLFASFIGMRSLDPGFDPEGLLVMGVDVKGVPGWGVEPPWQTWDALLAELEAVPGVQAAALASEIPLRRSDWEPRLSLPGDGPQVMRRGIAGYAITPGYLETIGARLVRGRPFERSDRADGERVALVNESFVRTQLGGGDALGVVVRWTFRGDFRGRRQLDRLTEMAGGDDEISFRIVGVVEDVVQARVAEGPRPAFYVPYTQARMFSPRAMVRTGLPPETVFPQLRRAAARYNPRHPEPVLELLTMRDLLAPEQPTLRFQAMLVGGFAMIALLLAATGLYGSLAHSVGRRRRELGIRIALGAARSGVLRMVLGQGLRLALAGAAVGSLAALVVARLLTGFLFRVQPGDPLSLLLVAAVMFAVAAIACVGPARRATAVDPVRVLAAE